MRCNAIGCWSRPAHFTRASSRKTSSRGSKTSCGSGQACSDPSSAHFTLAVGSHVTSVYMSHRHACLHVTLRTHASRVVIE